MSYHTTKNIQRFNLNELKSNTKQSASWHNEYDSAYVFIKNLNYGMNQGDIAIVFSEFGEIVDLRLMRDKETGKSRGFAFLAYQDQRSTILAVDNFNGVEICGRVLRVDHVKKYQPPREFLEVKQEIDGEKKQYIPTGPDGRGWGRFRKHTEQQLQALKRYKQQKNTKNSLIKMQIGQFQ